jgi:diguanylate cyclase (GGDEF)-like protein
MSNNFLKDRLENSGFTPREQQIPVIPSGVASILLLAVLLVNGILDMGGGGFQDIFLLTYCVVNLLVLAYFHFVLIPSSHLKSHHVWAYAIFEVVATAMVALLMPAKLDVYIGGLMILLCITASIIADRKPANFILIGITVILVIRNPQGLVTPTAWPRLLGATLISAVVNEAIHQFKTLTTRNINRLKTINEFSRKITSSLEIEQVLNLFNEAIPNTLQADSYFFGTLEKGELRLHLLYDEGEYFQDVNTKLDGTLSGWVIRNQKELFLPDLRRNPDLIGVEMVVIGQEKASLSWMGVPIIGVHVQGVIAVASYRPNAFNRSDMELMSNMAQHAALALDNTHHHAQVEKQSQIDSLTGVFNHGHFLNLLNKCCEEARLKSRPISVIMLDVDYFKQYNDTYGHLAGDEILTALCGTIRKHIKHTDLVGRWGGEEFVIALPGASGKQAQQVARRIHESMAVLKIKSMGRKSIPAPTLSQGIAQFPDEVDEIMKLVDLADRRLYIAKDRGRNQIEPSADHWKKILSY